MDHAGFIIAAWLIVAIALGSYALRLVVRGRALSKSVAPERRRWLDSKDQS